MKVSFFDTHPRMRAIYYVFAFIASIILWTASIMTVSSTLYIGMIGVGSNVLATFGLGLVASLPISGLMVLFAYKGISRRGRRMIDNFKADWAEYRKRKVAKKA